jgi:hypothetical protein
VEQISIDHNCYELPFVGIGVRERKSATACTVGYVSEYITLLVRLFDLNGASRCSDNKLAC